MAQLRSFAFIGPSLWNTLAPAVRFTILSGPILLFLSPQYLSFLSGYATIRFRRLGPAITGYRQLGPATPWSLYTKEALRSLKIK